MQYKILIVDDEPMLTGLLADYLGDMGYLPFMAADSVQALILAQMGISIIRWFSVWPLYGWMGMIG